MAFLTRPIFVNFKAKTDGGKDQRASQASQPCGLFSFGRRRYASKGPRRLFVPQKCLMSPAYEPEVERPHSIVHIRTATA